VIKNCWSGAARTASAVSISPVSVLALFVVGGVDGDWFWAEAAGGREVAFLLRKDGNKLGREADEPGAGIIDDAWGCTLLDELPWFDVVVRPGVWAGLQWGLVIHRQGVVVRDPCGRPVRCDGWRYFWDTGHRGE
jgi:hypothetical protein